jgi:hypothetical protein
MSKRNYTAEQIISKLKEIEVMVGHERFRMIMRVGKES